MDGPVRLVVLGDSLAFTDDRGPQLPSDPALYPNVAARRLGELTGREVEVTVLAVAGASIRDAWRVVSKDRHAQFDVLGRADAVVVGVGSYDHLPVGVPRALEVLVPYVRSGWLRRRVRRVLHASHPHLVRATAGRMRLTPQREFERLYRLVLQQVRGLRGGVAAVALAPVGQRSDHYARRNPHLDRGDRVQRAIAAEQGLPVVPTRELVAPFVDRLNVDGIHWPAEAHAAVGTAVAEALVEQVLGRVPTPPNPWMEVATGV